MTALVRNRRFSLYFRS